MVKEGIHRLTYSPEAMPSPTVHAHLGLSDACRNKGGLTMNSIRISMLNLPSHKMKMPFMDSSGFYFSY